MGTGTVRGDPRRRARRRRRRVIVLVAAIIGVLGRSAAGASPRLMQGSPVCRDLPGATTRDYVIGLACPPAGFEGRLGYRPVLRETPFGWRFTRPSSADGGCSGPLEDVGPFWDFTVPCQAHDYAYDLVRFGVADRGERM